MAYFIGYLISCIVFGFITKYVAESKGYEGGFWWGFFLGIIGLFVVGFRPNNNQQNSYSYNDYQRNTDSYYNSQSLTNKTIEPKASKKEEKKWICIKCKAENPEKSKFCCECGEPRHYDWKCSNCGEMNEAKVKFCYNCGKEKTISEEIIPQIDITDKSDLEKVVTANYTVVNEYQIKCENCGTIQRDIRALCYKCGAVFVKD